MVIVAALFISFGYKQIFKEEPNSGPSNQVPADVQDQKADTVDETANWKEYQDIKQGFSVKHPDDVKVEYTDEGFVRLSKWGPTQKPQTEFYDAIVLTFRPGSLMNINLKEYVSAQVEESKENSDILKQIEPVTIAGISGYTYTAQGLGIHRYIYLPKTVKDYFLIIDSTSDPGNLGFNKIAEQILSTFKFSE